MAGEIEFSGPGSGRVCYVLVRNPNGQIWNTSSLAFEAYATANLSLYAVSALEQGTASNFFTANFPSGITAPGTYNLTAKQRVGGSPAESDPTVASGELVWGGSNLFSLADA